MPQKYNHYPMLRLSCSHCLQLIERALIHGDSSFTIDGIVISNATFLSQQLQTWLSLLHDEFGSQFIAAATATCRFQPSLKWNQELIENKLSSLKYKSAKHSFFFSILAPLLTSCFSLQNNIIFDWYRLGIHLLFDCQNFWILGVVLWRKCLS